MKIFKFFTSRSLRFKILAGFLLSLLPLLAIMWISYSSARGNALESSQRIMNLITHNGAKEINDFIKTQELKFIEWTQEDLFGMAIEFKTTTEMQSYFNSFLQGQRGFSALVLADKEGKVLQAEVGEHIQGGSSEAFKGKTVKEVALLGNQAFRSAVFVTNDFMKQFGQKSAATYLFSFKTYDSEKNQNGYLLAFLDWSNLQAKVTSANEEMQTNGFDNAQVAILDTASGIMSGHSNEKLIDTSLEMTDGLKSWLKGSKYGEIRQFNLGKEIDFVTFMPVQSVAGLFEGSVAAQGQTNHALTVFVPESDIMAGVRKILLISAGIAGGACILIILVALVIVNQITKPLNRMIEGLKEGAEQVASSSGQVTSASQSLADSSSEQAASLEETSSSLEEMSSMTKQNADNANQADNLMKEANQVVGKANESMTELTASMNEISKASEETSKIIKTIDEIAFQTNLLALNAAVEAARAGEAGAGFAVVADEVRNLAMRAADAASNTAELIEGTVKKTKDGTELVVRTNEAFSEVATSAAKVGELVSEIAAASNEQSRGIEQVNTAVVDMDKITQRNAATSEESASASQEMSAQAEQMKDIVGDLVSLVGGGSAGRTGNDQQAAVLENKRNIQVRRTTSGTEITRDTGLATMKAAEEVSPNQVIPLDKDDFKDF